MQRISTVLATLALLLGMTFLAPSYTLAAVTSDVYTPVVTENEVSVFLETNNPKANIYAWSGDEPNVTKYAGAWPGSSMTLMGKSASGKNIYKWTSTMSGMPTGVIFLDGNGDQNGNKLQQKDQEFVNHGYYVDGVYSKTIEVAQPIGKVYVLFDNSTANLSDVYCYIYDGTKAAQEWPGLKMSIDNEITYNDKTGYYAVEVPEAFVTGYFVINNGEAGTTLKGETVYVNGVATAIESATVADVKKATDDAWYTITGIRINKPTQPGLYIHNGKKVIIRK